MKKTLLNLLIVISYIYCLAYILFGFSIDSFVMRAVSGVMSTIFSVSLLYFLLKFLNNKKTKISK